MVEMTPSFELEIETLDEDHQVMIDHANRIVELIDRDDGDNINVDDCVALVEGFVRLSKQHFAREEAILKKAGYPDVAGHEDHHRGLDSKMEHMLEFARQASSNPLARQNLKKELHYFILDDVITADMSFKDFIKENQTTSAGSPSKD
jgi:hemerythrin-like metal-binding protein